MSHIAILSEKYNEVIYNDIQPELVRLLMDAVDGKYDFGCFDPKFISHEEFLERKELDAYVKYVWSFSRHGRTYLYNKKKGKEKHSIFDYVVHGIRDEYIEKTHPQIDLKSTGIFEREKEWIATVKKVYGLPADDPKIVELRMIEPLWGIRRLQAMKGLNINFACMDYRDYVHQNGDVVYCDPPYEDAEFYQAAMGFDSKTFYDWVDSQSYPIWFSSYDNIDDMRFKSVWTKSKRNLMGGVTGAKMKVEVLYGNRWVETRNNNYGHVTGAQEQVTFWEREWMGTSEKD